jgi:hypothetical protein
LSPGGCTPPAKCLAGWTVCFFTEAVYHAGWRRSDNAKHFSVRFSISFLAHDFSLSLRTVFPQERSNAFSEMFIQFLAYY